MKHLRAVRKQLCSLL